MGNKQSHSEAEDTVAAAAVSRGKIATSLGAASSTTTVDDSEEPVEVPPPMQPISSVTLSAAVNDSKKVGMGNYRVKRSLHRPEVGTFQKKKIEIKDQDHWKINI